MVLELHVWGPAFSLPSIDPECLAVIAYLNQAVPRGQWVLLASCDAGWSPTRQLPALRDGEVVVGGFQNIIDHLREKSNGEWDLDSHTTNSKHRADITAFTSHIHTHLPHLLSLSLYISSENYTTTTRPAYTAILPFPTQYLIPPSHRSIAKTRSQHLNLSSLDLDTIDDDERSRRNFADVIPAALRSSRQSVTGLMKQKGSSKRFKLDGLVDAACEPLEKLLGQKKHFFGEDGMSSLDCLALGYLALAVTPDVPQKWLAEGLRDRWPGLRAFVRRGVGEGFGGLVRVEDALMGGNLESVGGKGLPWRATTQTGLSAAGTTLLNSALAALPFPQTTILTTPSKQQSTNSSSNNTPPSSSTSTLLPTLLAASTAVTAAAGYFLYASLNAEEEKRSLGDMGEAGAMLAGLDFGGRGERGRGKGREREVGVEVQEKGM